MKRSLEELFNNKTLKFIFVGGKGGVGKTTTSSAISIEMAKNRGKTLIISTDPAHNLSDAFNQQFSHEPTQVKKVDNLWAVEIDPKKQFDISSNFFENQQVFNESNKSFLNSIITQVPGIDEAIVFMNLLKMARNMDVDVVIFDTAPTGHTLKLLSFPDVIQKGLEKIMEFKDKISGMFNMMGMDSDQSITNMFEKLKELKKNTEELKKIMKDPSLTTFVAVCIPEFLSVYETERLIQELAIQNIDIFNIVVNQIVFPEGDCPKCQARYKMQHKYLNQIIELYDDFHLVFMQQENSEIRGIEKLKAYSEKLMVEQTLPNIS